jgi:hypothetical protein
MQRQCKDLCDRCTGLLLAFRDSSKGMEGTKAIELMDEVEASAFCLRLCQIRHFQTNQL